MNHTHTRYCIFSLASLALNLCCISIQAAPAAKPVKVAHWGHEKILIYAPLYIAIDGGFFERRGISATLVYSGNDDQVFATVLGGGAQFGVGDPVFTAISREKGGPGKVVAGLVGRVANWAVAKDAAIAPFTDPKRLDGLRVTSFPSPSTTFTILSGLKKDLNLSKMEIKQIAFGSEQAAVERGEADLAIMLEPQASLAEAQGYKVVWSIAEYYGNFALTGVTTVDQVIASEPETVQAFVSGLQDALSFTSSNPDAAALILARSFPTLDPKIVESATRRMVSDKTIPPSVVIDREAWLKTLGVRVSVGDLKSTVVADACLDQTFALQAHSGKNIARLPQPPSIAQESGILNWTNFGRLADVLSILTFLLGFSTLWAIYKRSTIRSFMRNCDSSILRSMANCFKSVHQEIKHDTMINLLMNSEAKLTEDSAAQRLSEFCAAGLLAKSTINGAVAYIPARTRFTQDCPLLDLVK